MTKTKKDFNYLTGAILAFIVVAVLTVIAFKIVGTVQKAEIAIKDGTIATCNSSSGTYTGCSIAYNGAEKVNTALNDMTGYYGIIAIIVILVVILGFLGVRKILGQ